MKLGPDALLKIMDIVREGLSEGKDISQGLREIDLEEDTVKNDETLRLVSGPTDWPSI
jgi:hypothetical protein